MPSKPAAKRRTNIASLKKRERFFLAMIQSGKAAKLDSSKGICRLSGQRMSLSAEEVEELVSADLVTWSGQGELVPTEAGLAWAKRRQDGADPYRTQHGDLSIDPSGRVIDLAESPLLWLYRRRDPSRKPLIGDAMFAAGERLRADFTSGNMGPRVTLNWDAAIRGGCNPHGAEPGENSLAARQRVRRAMARVGPELSGILIDVCCFLKRLEDVERDRQWPARSAKVILALALQRLARHYGYSDCAEGRDLRKAG
jgi:hypothetical protein